MASRAFKLTPPRAPRLSEADVTRQIKDFLALRGWIVIRNHVGTFVPLRIARDAISCAASGRLPDADRLVTRNVISINDEGTADLLAVHPEFPPIWIEMKRPKGDVRPSQERWLLYMREKRRFHAGHWDSIDSFVHFYRDKIDGFTKLL